MGRRSDPERVHRAQLTGARRRLDDLQRQDRAADDPEVIEVLARIAELDGRPPITRQERSGII